MSEDVCTAVKWVWEMRRSAGRAALLGEIGGGTVLAVSAECSDSGPHLSPAFPVC